MTQKNRKYLFNWNEKETLKESSKKLEKEYDEQSKRYDQIAQDPNDPWYKEMVLAPKEFVKLINPKKGELILDCACGTGMITIELAKKGAKVYAFDISKGMLDKLKSKIKDKKFKNNIIDIKKANFEKIPYENDKFDKVCCRGTLDCFHPKHYIKFIKEMKRVLKPKGYLIIDLPWPLGKLGRQVYNQKKCWTMLEIRKKLKEIGLILKKKNDIGMCHQLVFQVQE